MTLFASDRRLWSALLYLAGAAVAIFITGRLDVAAMVAATTGAALGMMVGIPSTRAGRWPVILSLLFAAATAAAFLPGSDGLPAWRSGAPAVVELAPLFAAMPWHLLFWWLTLVGTIIAAWFLLASPLDARMLRVFLHAVAGVVAAYAVVSIVQAQTAWTYPFSGGANFGLLPNRNHTATLLVVGAIISFGLMQWEVTHSHRAGAALSAVWGAPSLAALLFFSTSRAGVLFLALGFALWTAGAVGRSVQRRTPLIAAGILTTFLVALFVLGGSTVRDRLGSLWQKATQSETGEAGETTMDGRLLIYQDTAKMISEAPLTGQGMGHFEFVFPHYRDASRTKFSVLHPESDWLMVAAESGIPAALILVVLVGWYFARCWRGRREEGGLLRWTAASAIGAAVLHGVIDVPWHRPALGWFLLIVALVSVPGGGKRLRWATLWRVVQILLGLVFLCAAGWLLQAAKSDRPPLAYRWAGYAAELESLLAAGKYDDGEFVAREALGDFPLSHQAYYWRAAFLRMFEGSDKEMDADMAGGRFAEPVLPSVAAEQARLWEKISDRNEASARAEAVRRAKKIDQQEGGGRSANAQLEAALSAAQSRPGAQSELRQLVAEDPLMLAHWVVWADPSLADAYLSGLGPSAAEFLDSLPAEVRSGLVARWSGLPSAAGAVAYMEARNQPAPGPYWRQLANYYARAGDKPRAVALVAEATGVPLDGASLPAGEFAAELGKLQAQGNDVAVRRLVKEAVEAPDASSDKAAVVMVWYAQTGEWEMAWKAASRLVTATKTGH